MVSSYRDLIVWQKGMGIVAQSYALTKRFPQDERYGLVSQIRRAAISVPANIAEGFGRHHTGDYIRHLSVARGSLFELETEFMCAGMLGFMKAVHTDQIIDRTTEVGRMLSSLTRKLLLRRGV